MRPWERKLAICLAIASALFALSTCFWRSDPPAVKPAKFYVVDPLCPTGVWIAQRYDKRDRYGIIVERKWKRACVT